MKLFEFLIGVGTGIVVMFAGGAFFAVFRRVREGADWYAKKYQRHLGKRLGVGTKFIAILRNYGSSFLFFLGLLLVAVTLSYVEDFLRSMNRPEPLLSAAHYGSLLLLLADMIVFGKILWDLIRDSWFESNQVTDESDPTTRR